MGGIDLERRSSINDIEPVETFETEKLENEASNWDSPDETTENHVEAFRDLKSSLEDEPFEAPQGNANWITAAVDTSGRGTADLTNQIEFEGILDTAIEGVSGHVSASASTYATSNSWGTSQLDASGFTAMGGAEARAGVSAHVEGELVTPLGTISGSATATAEVYARAVGYVSANANGLQAEGLVEVGAIARVEAEVDAVMANGALVAHAEGYAEAGAGARATAAVHATLNPPEIAARVKAEAFAGARAGFSAQAGAPGASAHVAGEVWAGAGAKVQLDVGVQDGVLRFDAQIGAAIGIGGSLNFGVDIDFKDPVKAVGGIANAINTVSNPLGLIVGALTGGKVSIPDPFSALFGAISGALAGGAQTGSSPKNDLGFDLPNTASQRDNAQKVSDESEYSKATSSDAKKKSSSKSFESKKSTQAKFSSSHNLNKANPS